MDSNSLILCEQLDPSTGLQISVALLRGVKNSKTLKDNVMSGALQCAIIKPALIVDPFQVIVAANKAAISLSSGTMVTKSVYTELLFNLSISKNITQSLVKFGIHEADEDILIATLDKSDTPSINKVVSDIEGKMVPLSCLQDIYDRKLVCKSYKINDTETGTTSLVDSVISRIATSEFISH